MKIYIADKDQTGIVIADYDTYHAMKHFDSDTGTIMVVMDKVIVKVTVKELNELLMCAANMGYPV